MITESATHLTISTQSGARHQWRFSQTYIVDSPYDDIPGSIGCHDDPDAQLQLANSDFVRIAQHIPRPALNVKTPAMIVAFIALVAIAIIWVIPTLSPVLAAVTPISWERKLGRFVVAELNKNNSICTNPDTVRILTTMHDQLNQDGRLPLVDIAVLNMPQANAFALPGGYILLTRALINQVETPEELAGILAHEIGHIVHHHPMEGFIRHVGTAGLIDIVTGGGGTVIYGAAVLYNLQHNRNAEQEADIYAAQRMTSQGYDVAPMARFFERMSRTTDHDENDTDHENDDSVSIGAWLSTHPSDDERIAYFTHYEKPNNPQPLLNAQQWAHLKQAAKGCTSTPTHDDE